MGLPKTRVKINVANSYIFNIFFPSEALDEAVKVVGVQAIFSYLGYFWAQLVRSHTHATVLCIVALS